MQAAVGISWTASGPYDELLNWAASLDRFRPDWIAIRISFDGKQITRTLVVTCEENREGELCRLMAALWRVQRSTCVSLKLPFDADDHDSLLGINGDVISLFTPVYEYAGTRWVNKHVSINSNLDPIFEAAVLQGRPFSYQVVLTRHAPLVEVERAMRRSSIRLRDVAGFGSTRLAEHNQIADSYPSTSYIVSEVANAGADGAQWLDMQLRRLRSNCDWRFPELLSEPDGGHSIAIDFDAAHLDQNEAAYEIANAAATSTVLTDLLAWWPTGVCTSLSDMSDLRSERIAASTTPIVSAKDNEDFFFISYARRDSQAVTPLLQGFVAAGLSIWADTGIEAGSQWVETLENRLERCIGVLLFVSPASMNSAYVRSEITFAYISEKKVFPIFLEETSLPPGLRIILSGIQFKLAEEKSERDRLLATLLNHSRTYNSTLV
ncbi:toll/interleukin-1 receptor domain-containing protein [Rhizobium ruizarguesonis]|uniref:toll/interleukin-1 receptor domain-containing protein n=1 Tax=Rhizobium ruizarguesonis TaxID=2081791 RepID=UPI00103209F2|nr:toll/interleukin-1 receptor domain-containing protein [Rhizobium ruizarguesonis]TAT93009.1 toll/interleukin-1 receptor domain-containing protein [Rhizobium ruizarguesonis]